MISSKAEGDSDSLPLLLSMEIPKQLQESQTRLLSVEAAVSDLQRHHEIWSGVARDGLADLWVKCNTLTEEVQSSKTKGVNQHVGDELRASASDDAKGQVCARNKEIQELRSELASESTRSKVRLDVLSQRVESNDRQVQALQKEVAGGRSSFEDLLKSVAGLKSMVTEELGRLSDTSIVVDEVTEKVLQRLKAQQVTPELHQELHQTLRENSARCLALGRSLDSEGSQADPCEMLPKSRRGEMAAVLDRGSGSPFQKTYQRSRSFWLQHLQSQKQDQQRQRHLQQLQQRMKIPMDPDCGMKQTDLEEMPNIAVTRSDGQSSLTSARTATPLATGGKGTTRESMPQDAFPRTPNRSPKRSHGSQNAACSTAWSSAQHAVQVPYDTPSLGGRQAPPASPRGRCDHIIT